VANLLSVAVDERRAVEAAMEEQKMVTKSERERERYEARRKSQFDYNSLTHEAREIGGEIGRRLLISRIHYFERLLRRPVTPDEQWSYLSIDDLVQLSDKLVAELRQEPAETKLVEGLAHARSANPVSETIRKLEALAATRDLTIFARIDFSGDAKRAGLEMRPKQLLVIGNPKALTPLLIASPTVAIDLPLKVLVWEDAGGKTWLSYNTPEYCQIRHNFPDELVENIEDIRGLVEAATASNSDDLAGADANGAIAT
jgi:uncharacterized protein (DUF302 family)